MPAQPTTAEPICDPGQQAAVDAQYYRAILHDLIDKGVELANIVHAQAKAQAQAQSDADTPPGTAPDLTLPFDRIARAIRRTIALARRIAEPVRPAAPTPAQTRIVARSKIIRDVEDTIQRDTTGATANKLHTELVDRLDAPEFDRDILDRPIADIITEICRDLGLAAPPGSTPWKRRTPADIAALHARAAQAPAAPAAQLKPAPAAQVTTAPAPQLKLAPAAEPKPAPQQAAPAAQPAATKPPITPTIRGRRTTGPPRRLTKAAEAILRHALQTAHP